MSNSETDKDGRIWCRDSDDDIYAFIDPDDGKPYPLTEKDWSRCERIVSVDDPDASSGRGKTVPADSPMLQWDCYLNTGIAPDNEGIIWGLLIKGNPEHVTSTVGVVEFY
ncbi:hypothetical protein [Mycobacterium sp. E1747]|uniref:hypothetical protein n=1 Tax=Mycobacterium sp. E1747 TaxID=1834128 RepID=UPI0007FCF8FA|nr:hypothetical protein [Mycobacterium sp. E1747]OBH08954.1 hypothetical protein A5695_25295 [Mycobacterium sp. E1747]